VSIEQKNGRFPYEINLEYTDFEKRNKALFELVIRVMSESSSENKTPKE
jgi:hypothetical protein